METFALNFSANDKRQRSYLQHCGILKLDMQWEPNVHKVQFVYAPKHTCIRQKYFSTVWCSIWTFKPWVRDLITKNEAWSSTLKTTAIQYSGFPRSCFSFLLFLANLMYSDCHLIFFWQEPLYECVERAFRHQLPSIDLILKIALKQSICHYRRISYHSWKTI